MRAIIFMGWLLAAGLLTGCSTTTIDARGGSEICELHHQFMHAEKVKSHDRPPASRAYLEARVRGFIHSYPFMLPARAHTEYLIYLCGDCVRAEEAWKAAHPGYQD